MARVAPLRTIGVARAGFAPRGVVSGRFVGRSFVGGRGFAPRFIGPRIVVAPHRFTRPFYAFRPRFSLAFGLWVGFPVAYPYDYDYPYPYGYSYPYAQYPYAQYPYAQYPYAAAYPSAYPPSTYGYPASSGYPAAGYPTGASPAQTYPSAGSVGVQQQGQDGGGVSFEITPNTARVLVDGTEVGSVAEFSATSAPLTLTLGRHHIELRAAGYQTMGFDAEILAGQVIPYRGEMQPQR